MSPINPLTLFHTSGNIASAPESSETPLTDFQASVTSHFSPKIPWHKQIHNGDSHRAGLKLFLDLSKAFDHFPTTDILPKSGRTKQEILCHHVYHVTFLIVMLYTVCIFRVILYDKPFPFADGIGIVCSHEAGSFNSAHALINEDPMHRDNWCSKWLVAMVL